jgi:hypothetical protein
VRELRRVARQRVVLLTLDPTLLRAFWLIRDYLPHAVPASQMPIGEVLDHLGGGRVTPVLIPSDCHDGFIHAFWRRPAVYLDANIRASMSFLAPLLADEVDAALGRLERDIRSGAWAKRNRELLELDALDCGYRLVVSERLCAGRI